MKLTIGIPVLNQEEATQKTLDSLKNTQNQDNQYVIVDNGCDRFVRDWLMGLTGNDIVIKNHQNVGLPKALNQILSASDGEYVFMTHTDIEMFEQGWDDKIRKAIEENGNVGVAGFYGAFGIGTSDIYRTPYAMKQLVRTTPVAGDRCRQDPKIHGHAQFSQDWVKCAVLDGFSLIVKNNAEFRFEEGFGPHHMYDNDICLQALDKGMDVITINMDVVHYGGKTDVGEDWASVFGKTKQQVHQESHPPFYNKWKPGNHNISLPVRVV